MNPRDERPAFARYASVGFEFAAVIALLALAGFWADQHLGTTPALTVFGAVVGIVYGLYRAVQLGRELEQREKSRRDKARQDGPDGGPAP